MIAHTSQYPGNPCTLSENEQTPAKIWELLRRNKSFRADVERLIKLDAKERDDWKKTGKYHGEAWKKSCRLIGRIKGQHPFAGVALQWLVPEPLFHCYVSAWPRGKKWKKRPVFATRFIQTGKGLTPNIKDKHWVWRNEGKPDIAGHPIRRGPEVHWTKSRFKALRSKVNPILEWKQYRWPFTTDHSWSDAPPQLRRDFLFIWRRHFDCRPKNPISNDRCDSPSPHETNFFQGWNLLQRIMSNNCTMEDATRNVHFTDLANNYRLFAIPKTILTKATADEMGEWLAAEFKKGSDLYGDLLKGKLLNEAELLGTANEWADWLSRQAGKGVRAAKDTHFYRRCRYINSLVDCIYPHFDISKLLAPPKHRARGKPYVRKK